MERIGGPDALVAQSIFLYILIYRHIYICISRVSGFQFLNSLIEDDKRDLLLVIYILPKVTNEHVAMASDSLCIESD